MSENNYSWDSTLPAQAEQKEFSVPPIGEYNFIVMSAEKTYSNSGNPMIKVRLDLQGADGSVFDNLVLTDSMMWKLVSFFESIGIKEPGKALDVSIASAADTSVGLEGRLKIKHENYQGKPQARVDKYLIPDAKKASKAPESAATPEFNMDDVPFQID